MSNRSRRLFRNSARHRAVSERAVLQTQEEAKIQGCRTGKKIIKKKQFALAAASKLTAKHRTPHRVYRCWSCRHFHTTSRGDGINPESGKRENPAKAAKAPPLDSLVGVKVKQMVRRIGI